MALDVCWFCSFWTLSTIYECMHYVIRFTCLRSIYLHSQFISFFFVLTMLLLVTILDLFIYIVATFHNWGLIASCLMNFYEGYWLISDRLSVTWISHVCVTWTSSHAFTCRLQTCDLGLNLNWRKHLKFELAYFYLQISMLSASAIYGFYLINSFLLRVIQIIKKIKCFKLISFLFCLILFPMACFGC